MKHTILPAYRSHRFDLTDSDLHSWYLKFKEMPDLAVIEAAQEYVTTHNFPPTQADLQKLINKRLLSRPGDYGWKPSWALPGNNSKPKSMPPEVRQRINKLMEEAEELKNKGITDKSTEILQNPNNPMITRQSAEELKERRIENHIRSIKDYCRRTYEHRDGRWRIKDQNLRREEKITMNGKSCRVREYDNGMTEILDIEGPSFG